MLGSDIPVPDESFKQTLLDEDFVRSQMNGDSIREYLRLIDGIHAYEMISTYYMSREFFDYETMLFISELIDDEYKFVASFVIPDRRENASGGLVLMDIDFDDVKDILVWLGRDGNHGVIYYSAFLHRGDTFIESDFDGFPNPVVDSENKKLGGFIRTGAHSYRSFMYALVDGHFVLTDSFTREFLDTDEIRYIITLRDGLEVNEFYCDPTDRTQIEMLLYDEGSSWGLNSERWQNPFDLH